MGDRESLRIVRTDEENTLTDAQIVALKSLTPEEIKTLRYIALVPRSMQVVIGILAGVAATLALLNIKAISNFLNKLS